MEIINVVPQSLTLLEQTHHARAVLDLGADKRCPAARQSADQCLVKERIQILSRSSRVLLDKSVYPIAESISWILLVLGIALAAQQLQTDQSNN